MRRPKFLVDTPWTFWECCNDESRQLLEALGAKPPEEKITIESVEEISRSMRQPGEGKLPK